MFVEGGGWRNKKGSMIKGIKVLKVVERRHERIVEEICIYPGPICLGFFCCWKVFENSGHEIVTIKWPCVQAYEWLEGEYVPKEDFSWTERIINKPAAVA